MKINIAVKKLKWWQEWIPIDSKKLKNLNNFEQIINVFI